MQKHQHCDHKTATKGSVKLNIAQFFGCCLGAEPAPIPEKIQTARTNLSNNSVTEIHHQPGEPFHITPDMIIADLLLTFPIIKNYLEDLHPLGLLSPALETTSLEMFLLDFNLNLDEICRDLDCLINQNNQSNS